MSGAVHELTAQELLIVRFVHNFLISGFIFDHHESITRCMQRENWNVDPAVEDNVFLEILDGVRICLDSGGMIQSFQILMQIQASLFIERPHFLPVTGTLELLLEIDSGGPGNIATGARFQFSTESKDEREIHLCVPEKLVCFLSREIRWRRLGRCGSKPAGRAAERRS